MPQWNTKYNENISKDLANYADRSSGTDCVGKDNFTQETDRRQFIHSRDIESLEVNGGKCLTDNEGTVDADDIHNDSDTSSSFSLQECMNEFRARRIRRTSLTQQKQEADKKRISNCNNLQETSEIDLINQNLCNKEQERKIKPCKNGFCYCFTSDSGDGGSNLVGCHKMKNLQLRNSRRSKRLECIEISNSDKNAIKMSKDRKSQKAKTEVDTCTYFKSSEKEPNRLKSISRLEASTIDGPLIHIIQELRDNCVISTVKVNRRKMQLFKDNTFKNEKTGRTKTQTSNWSDQTKPIRYNTGVKYTPSAPTLETFYDLCNATNTLEKNEKCEDCSEKRHNTGGQLLKKRLSISQIRYSPIDIEKPPPKPPRTSIYYGDNDCESFTSTSSSVRAAERVVDDFLVKKGNTTNISASAKCEAKLKTEMGQTKSMKPSENVKRKPEQLLCSKTKRQPGKIPTYTSLSDMEKIIESNKLTQYEKNIRPAMDDVPKVMSVGWKETKIKDMLSYDDDMNQGDFHSTSIKAQPQQHPSTDAVRNERLIGWQMPPKVNLDTVDGIVHHNLASNFDDKNTPVKKSFISSSQNSKDETRTQKVLWSEQLKKFSPWSKKCNIYHTNKSNQKMHSRSSEAFIISSKNKLLRLVSPKKRNGGKDTPQITKTSHHNVAVQTSSNDVSRDATDSHNEYQHSSSLQSPPGSYHSPIQSSSHIQCPALIQSQNTTPSETNPSSFDFSRTIDSPTKKESRSTNRKLNFPLNCSFASKNRPHHFDIWNSPDGCNQKKTYRSFNSEVDQDASISKISYILSNLRAKLEASDQEAVHTFLETGNIGEHNSASFHRSNSHHVEHIVEDVDLHKYAHPSTAKENDFNDPIYSEIEDDSVFLSQSSEFDNHTGVQHFVVAHNPEVFYAKVNKATKTDRDKLQHVENKQQLPLAKIMKDSLQSKKIITNFTPLPTLPEPPGSESTSNYLPLSSYAHCQSLNNVRMMEHNSSPKNHRYLDKSDLSLHRSEIFRKNLCKSELIIDERKNLEKVENDIKEIKSSEKFIDDNLSISAVSLENITHSDSVSYELPNDVDVNNSAAAGSNISSNTIAPPSFNIQSTPKKRSFVTKDETITKMLNLDAEVEKISIDLCNSYPNTPWKQCPIEQQNQPRSYSMNEVSEHESMKNSKLKTLNALERYSRFKTVLHNSFRESKKFIRNKGKRLSTSLNLSTSNAIVSPDKQSRVDSVLNLDDLLSLNESTDIGEQIAQTVCICRKLSDLKTSMEMVEAERLLLYSTLRRQNHLTFSSTATTVNTVSQKSNMRFFIDDIFLPVISDINQDIFFNYFYIITFECGGVIKSTQSSECVDGTAVFRDSGIEFTYCSELESGILNGSQMNAVKCNIFMLRLRKISTISTEPKKKGITETFTQNFSATIKSTTSSSTSSSSFNEVVSRFQMHASFTLDAKDFAPFEYVHQESFNSDRVCIRASCLCTLPLTVQKKTNLSEQLRLKGRAEVRIPKRDFSGFLNVRDRENQHNWNKRWCTLDGIFLNVWQDINSLSDSPHLEIDLRYSKNNMNFPLICLSRELCARPRSFSLVYKVNKACEDAVISSVVFAADSQEDVDDWLKNLNNVLNFIATWL